MKVNCNKRRINAMFRENSNHNQTSIFESTNWMSTRVKNKLEKSWAPIFYEHVFCKIDETPFAILYSDTGRPNFPVNILICLEFIKHFLSLTDDELIDNFYFNYLVNYAIGIRVLGELNLAERTLYEFRNRLYYFAIKHPGEDDLVFKQFILLLNEFAKTSGISMKEQRMDSTMFMSSIKKSGRLSLAFDVLIKAVKSIPEDNLTDSLKEVLKPEFRTNTLFKTKASETDTKLVIVLNLCSEAKNVLNSIEATEKTADTLRIVSRFIKEQSDIDKETNRLVAKASKEIPTNSLQSAYDEDATYRIKADKKQSGYVANFSETCSKDNDVQFITDYKVDQNIKSDIDFMEERLPVIKENTDCEVLYVDGGYYSESNAKNNNGVEVNFTDMTGREPSVKIPVSDFEFDNNNIITRCPNGNIPKYASVSNSQSSAHFPNKCCENCELSEKCYSKKQKKDHVVRINNKSIESANQRKKMHDNRKTNVSYRAGIEGTNSALKRSQGMDKLNVTGRAKCSVVVGLKVTAQNIRRLVKVISNAIKKDQFEIKGISLPIQA